MIHKIKIVPDNLEINVEDNTDLLTAISKSGLRIRASCGGKGICGKCKVIIKDGKYVTKNTHLLTESEKKRGYVLACQTKVIDNLLVEIPLQYEEVFTPAEKTKRFSERTEEEVFTFCPLVKKIFVKLEKPSLSNTTADFERLV